MIKAIVFDYGGTLTRTNVPWDTVSERIAARLMIDDIEIDPVDLEAAINDTIEYRAEQHKTGVELNSYQFFNHVLNTLDYSVDADVATELEQYVVDESETQFMSGLDDTLMELSESYKLALLSNSWLEAPRQILRENGYGRWFEVILCSFDIGIPKPDPRIFHHVLDLLMVEPYEAVMVGDSLEADIKGALEVGMKAVLMDDGFSDWDGPKLQELVELPELIMTLETDQQSI